MALLSGARLLVLEKEGEKVSREIPIRTSQVKFGSHPLNTIRLNSDVSERLHCKIFVKNDQVLDMSHYMIQYLQNDLMKVTVIRENARKVVDLWSYHGKERVKQSYCNKIYTLLVKEFYEQSPVFIANYSAKVPVAVDGNKVAKRGTLSDGSLLEVCGTRFRWQFDESKLLMRAEKAKKAEQTPTSSKYGKRRRTTMVRKKQSLGEKTAAAVGSGKKTAPKKSQKTPTYTLPKTHKQLMKNIRKRFTVHSIALNQHTEEETLDDETVEDEDVAQPSQTDSASSKTPTKTATPVAIKNETPFYTPELDKENSTPVVVGRTPRTASLQLENSAMIILSYTPTIDTRSKANIQKTPLSSAKKGVMGLRSAFLTPKNENVSANVTPLGTQKAGNTYLIDLTTPTSGHSSFVSSPLLDKSSLSSSSFSAHLGLIDLTTPSPKKVKTPSSTVMKSSQKVLLKSALKNASRTPRSALRARLPVTSGSPVIGTPKNVPKIKIDDKLTTSTTSVKSTRTPVGASKGKLASQLKTPVLNKTDPTKLVQSSKKENDISKTAEPNTPTVPSSAYMSHDTIEEVKTSPVMTTDELFDTLVGRQSVKKTYARKSNSPKKTQSSLVVVEGSSELPKTDIDLWVESVVATVTSPDPLDIDTVMKMPNRTTQVRSSQYSDITPHESFVDGSNAPLNEHVTGEAISQEQESCAQTSVALSENELDHMDENPSVANSNRRSYTPITSKIARSLGNKRQTIGNFFTNMFGKLTVSPVTRLSITDEKSLGERSVHNDTERMSENGSDGSEDVYHDTETDHSEEIANHAEQAAVSSPKLRQSLRDTRKFIGNALTSLNTSKPLLDNTAEIDESLLLNDTCGEDVDENDLAEEIYDLTDLNSPRTAAQEVDLLLSAQPSTPKTTTKQFSRKTIAVESDNQLLSPQARLSLPTRFGSSIVGAGGSSTPVSRRIIHEASEVGKSPLATPLENTPTKTLPTDMAEVSFTEHESELSLVEGALTIDKSFKESIHGDIDYWISPDVDKTRRSLRKSTAVGNPQTPPLQRLNMSRASALSISYAISPVVTHDADMSCSPKSPLLATPTIDRTKNVTIANTSALDDILVSPKRSSRTTVSSETPQKNVMKAATGSAIVETVNDSVLSVNEEEIKKNTSIAANQSVADSCDVPTHQPNTENDSPVDGRKTSEVVILVSGSTPTRRSSRKSVFVANTSQQTPRGEPTKSSQIVEAIETLHPAQLDDQSSFLEDSKCSEILPKESENNAATDDTTNIIVGVPENTVADEVVTDLTLVDTSTVQLIADQKEVNPVETAPEEEVVELSESFVVNLETATTETTDNIAKSDDADLTNVHRLQPRNSKSEGIVCDEQLQDELTQTVEITVATNDTHSEQLQGTLVYRRSISPNTGQTGIPKSEVVSVTPTRLSRRSALSITSSTPVSTDTDASCGENLTISMQLDSLTTVDSVNEPHTGTTINQESIFKTPARVLNAPTRKTITGTPQTIPEEVATPIGKRITRRNTISQTPSHESRSSTRSTLNIIDEPRNTSISELPNQSQLMETTGAASSALRADSPKTTPSSRAPRASYKRNTIVVMEASSDEEPSTSKHLNIEGSTLLDLEDAVATPPRTTASEAVIESDTPHSKCALDDKPVASNESPIQKGSKSSFDTHSTPTVSTPIRTRKSVVNTPAVSSTPVLGRTRKSVLAASIGILSPLTALDTPADAEGSSHECSPLNESEQPILIKERSSIAKTPSFASVSVGKIVDEAESITQQDPLETQANSSLAGSSAALDISIASPNVSTDLQCKTKDSGSYAADLSKPEKSDYILNTAEESEIVSMENSNLAVSPIKAATPKADATAPRNKAIDQVEKSTLGLRGRTSSANTSLRVSTPGISRVLVSVENTDNPSQVEPRLDASSRRSVLNTSSASQHAGQEMLIADNAGTRVDAIAETGSMIVADVSVEIESTSVTVSTFEVESTLAPISAFKECKVEKKSTLSGTEIEDYVAVEAESSLFVGNISTEFESTSLTVSELDINSTLASNYVSNTSKCETPTLKTMSKTIDPKSSDVAAPTTVEFTPVANNALNESNAETTQSLGKMTPARSVRGKLLASTTKSTTVTPQPISENAPPSDTSVRESRSPRKNTIDPEANDDVTPVIIQNTPVLNYASDKSNAETTPSLGEMFKTPMRSVRGKLLASTIQSATVTPPISVDALATDTPVQESRSSRRNTIDPEANGDVAAPATNELTPVAKNALNESNVETTVSLGEMIKTPARSVRGKLLASATKSAAVTPQPISEYAAASDTPVRGSRSSRRNTIDQEAYYDVAGPATVDLTPVANIALSESNMATPSLGEMFKTPARSLRGKLLASATKSPAVTPQPISEDAPASDTPVRESRSSRRNTIDQQANAVDSPATVDLTPVANNALNESNLETTPSLGEMFKTPARSVRGKLLASATKSAAVTPQPISEDAPASDTPVRESRSSRRNTIDQQANDDVAGPATVDLTPVALNESNVATTPSLVEMFKTPARSVRGKLLASATKSAAVTPQPISEEAPASDTPVRESRSSRRNTIDQQANNDVAAPATVDLTPVANNALNESNVETTPSLGEMFKTPARLVRGKLLGSATKSAAVTPQQIFEDAPASDTPVRGSRSSRRNTIDQQSNDDVAAPTTVELTPVANNALNESNVETTPSLGQMFKTPARSVRGKLLASAIKSAAVTPQPISEDVEDVRESRSSRRNTIDQQANDVDSPATVDLTPVANNALNESNLETTPSLGEMFKTPARSVRGKLLASATKSAAVTPQQISEDAPASDTPVRESRSSRRNTIDQQAHDDVAEPATVDLTPVANNALNDSNVETTPSLGEMFKTPARSVRGKLLASATKSAAVTPQPISEDAPASDTPVRESRSSRRNTIDQQTNDDVAAPATVELTPVANNALNESSVKTTPSLVEKLKTPARSVRGKLLASATKSPAVMPQPISEDAPASDTSIRESRSSRRNTIDPESGAARIDLTPVANNALKESNVETTQSLAEMFKTPARPVRGNLLASATKSAAVTPQPISEDAPASDTPVRESRSSRRNTIDQQANDDVAEPATVDLTPVANNALNESNVETTPSLGEMFKTPARSVRGKLLASAAVTPQPISEDAPALDTPVRESRSSRRNTIDQQTNDDVAAPATVELTPVANNALNESNVETTPSLGEMFKTPARSVRGKLLASATKSAAVTPQPISEDAPASDTPVRESRSSRRNTIDQQTNDDVAAPATVELTPVANNALNESSVKTTPSLGEMLKATARSIRGKLLASATKSPAVMPQPISEDAPASDTFIRESRSSRRNTIDPEAGAPRIDLTPVVNNALNESNGETTPSLGEMFKTPARPVRGNLLASATKSADVTPQPISEDAPASDTPVRESRSSRRNTIDQQANDDVGEPATVDLTPVANNALNESNVETTPSLVEMFKTPARSVRGKLLASATKSAAVTPQPISEDAPASDTPVRESRSSRRNTIDQQADDVVAPATVDLTLVANNAWNKSNVETTPSLGEMFKTPARSVRGKLLASATKSPAVMQQPISDDAPASDTSIRESRSSRRNTIDPEAAAATIEFTPVANKAFNESNVETTPSLGEIFKTPARSVRGKLLASATKSAAVTPQLISEDTPASDTPVRESRSSRRNSIDPEANDDVAAAATIELTAVSNNALNESNVETTPSLVEIFKTPARSVRGKLLASATKSAAVTPQLISEDAPASDTPVRESRSSRRNTIDQQANADVAGPSTVELTPVAKNALNESNVETTPSLGEMFKTPARSVRGKLLASATKSDIATPQPISKDTPALDTSIRESRSSRRNTIDEQAKVIILAALESTPVENNVFSESNVEATPSLEAMFKTPAQSFRKKIVQNESNAGTTPSLEYKTPVRSILDKHPASAEKSITETPTQTSEDISTTNTPVRESRSSRRSTIEPPSTPVDVEISLFADSSVVSMDASNTLSIGENELVSDSNTTTTIAGDEENVGDNELHQSLLISPEVSASSIRKTRSVNSTPAPKETVEELHTPFAIEETPAKSGDFFSPPNIKSVALVLDETISTPDVMPRRKRSIVKITSQSRATPMSQPPPSQENSMGLNTSDMIRERKLVTPKAVESSESDLDNLSTTPTPNTQSNDSADVCPDLLKHLCERVISLECEIEELDETAQDSTVFLEGMPQLLKTPITVVPVIKTPITVPMKRRLYTKNDPEDKTPENVKSVEVRHVSSSEYLNIIDATPKATSSDEKKNRNDKKRKNRVNWSDSEDEDNHSFHDMEQVKKVLPSRASRRNIKTLCEDALAGASPEAKFVKPKPPKVAAIPEVVGGSTSSTVDVPEIVDHKISKRQEIENRSNRNRKNRDSSDSEINDKDRSPEAEEQAKKILPSRTSTKNFKSLAEEDLVEASPEYIFVKPEPPKVVVPVDVPRENTSMPSTETQAKDQESSMGRRKVMFNDHIQVKEINSPAVVGDIIKKISARGRGRKAKQAVEVIVEQSNVLGIKPATRGGKRNISSDPVEHPEISSKEDSEKQSLDSDICNTDSSSAVKKPVRRGAEKKNESIEEHIHTEYPLSEEDGVSKPADPDVIEVSDAPISKRSRRGTQKQKEEDVRKQARAKGAQKITVEDVPIEKVEEVQDIEIADQSDDTSMVKSDNRVQNAEPVGMITESSTAEEESEPDPEVADENDEPISKRARRGKKVDDVKTRAKPARAKNTKKAAVIEITDQSNNTSVTTSRLQRVNDEPDDKATEQVIVESDSNVVAQKQNVKHVKKQARGKTLKKMTAENTENVEEVQEQTEHNSNELGPEVDEESVEPIAKRARRGKKVEDLKTTTKQTRAKPVKKAAAEVATNETVEELDVIEIADQSNSTSTTTNSLHRVNDEPESKITEQAIVESGSNVVEVSDEHIPNRARRGTSKKKVDEGKSKQPRGKSDKKTVSSATEDVTIEKVPVSEAVKVAEQSDVVVDATNEHLEASDATESKDGELSSVPKLVEEDVPSPKRSRRGALKKNVASKKTTSSVESQQTSPVVTEIPQIDAVVHAAVKPASRRGAKKKKTEDNSVAERSADVVDASIEDSTRIEIVQENKSTDSEVFYPADSSVKEPTPKKPRRGVASKNAVTNKVPTRRGRGAVFKAESTDDEAANKPEKKESVGTVQLVSTTETIVASTKQVEQAVADSTSHDEPKQAPAKRGRGRTAAAKKKATKEAIESSELVPSSASDMLSPPPPPPVVDLVSDSGEEQSAPKKRVGRQASKQIVSNSSETMPRRGRQKAQQVDTQAELHHTIEESLNESHMVKTLLALSHTSTPLTKISEVAQKESVVEMEGTKPIQSRTRRVVNPIVAALIEESTPQKTVARGRRAATRNASQNDSNALETSGTPTAKRGRGRATAKSKLAKDSQDVVQSNESQQADDQLHQASGTVGNDGSVSTEAVSSSSRSGKNQKKVVDVVEPAKQTNDDEETETKAPKRSRRAPAKLRGADVSKNTEHAITLKSQTVDSESSHTGLDHDTQPTRNRRGMKTKASVKQQDAIPSVTKRDRSEEDGDIVKENDEQQPAKKSKSVAKEPATKKKGDVTEEGPIEVSVAKKTRKGAKKEEPAHNETDKKEDTESTTIPAGRKRPVRSRK